MTTPNLKAKPAFLDEEKIFIKNMFLSLLFLYNHYAFNKQQFLETSLKNYEATTLFKMFFHKQY